MTLQQEQRSLKITCAYLGTPYLGWQETQEGPSIEGCLRLALQQVLQHPIVLQAASRTDRGVHAEGQVVQFLTTRWDWDLSILRYALQGLLAPYITIQAIEEVPLSFHPTLHVLSKEYRYYLCLDNVQLPFFRKTSWHILKPLDLSRMRQAMQLLVGTHSFRGLCNQRKNIHYTDYRRTLIKLSDHELPHNRLCIVIQGDHFLYKMARNIVGTLVQIGEGSFPLEELSSRLKTENRTLMGITAPAHGLFLHSIYYPEKYEENTTLKIQCPQIAEE